MSLLNLKKHLSIASIRALYAVVEGDSSLMLSSGKERYARTFALLCEAVAEMTGADYLLGLSAYWSPREPDHFHCSRAEFSQNVSCDVPVAGSVRAAFFEELAVQAVAQERRMLAAETSRALTQAAQARVADLLEAAVQPDDLERQVAAERSRAAISLVMNRLFRAPSTEDERLSAWHDIARGGSSENPLGNTYPWRPDFRFDCVGLTADEVRRLLQRDIDAELSALRRRVPINAIEDVVDVQSVLDLIAHAGAIPRPVAGRFGRILDAHLNYFVRHREMHAANRADRGYGTRADADISPAERQQAERVIASLLETEDDDPEEA